MIDLNYTTTILIDLVIAEEEEEAEEEELTVTDKTAYAIVGGVFGGAFLVSVAGTCVFFKLLDRHRAKEDEEEKLEKDGEGK